MKSSENKFGKTIINYSVINPVKLLQEKGKGGPALYNIRLFTLLLVTRSNNQSQMCRGNGLSMN